MIGASTGHVVAAMRLRRECGSGTGLHPERTSAGSQRDVAVSSRAAVTPTSFPSARSPMPEDAALQRGHRHGTAGHRRSRRVHLRLHRCGLGFRFDIARQRARAHRLGERLDQILHAREVALRGVDRLSAARAPDRGVRAGDIKVEIAKVDAHRRREVARLALGRGTRVLRLPLPPMCNLHDHRVSARREALDSSA